VAWYSTGTCCRRRPDCCNGTWLVSDVFTAARRLTRLRAPASYVITASTAPATSTGDLPRPSQVLIPPMWVYNPPFPYYLLFPFLFCLALAFLSLSFSSPCLGYCSCFLKSLLYATARPTRKPLGHYYRLCHHQSTSCFDRCVIYSVGYSAEISRASWRMDQTLMRLQRHWTATSLQTLRPPRWQRRRQQR